MLIEKKSIKNIIEYIGESIRTSMVSSGRLAHPCPGDVVIASRREQYPFNQAEFGRIEKQLEDGSFIVCWDDNASVFLGNGWVKISGGPWNRIENLSPQNDLKIVRFWNWGDNPQGKDRQVDYFVARPVFLYLN